MEYRLNNLESSARENHLNSISIISKINSDRRTSLTCETVRINHFLDIEYVDFKDARAIRAESFRIE